METHLKQQYLRKRKSKTHMLPLQQLLGEFPLRWHTGKYWPLYSLTKISIFTAFKNTFPVKYLCQTWYHFKRLHLGFKSIYKNKYVMRHLRKLFPFKHRHPTFSTQFQPNSMTIVHHLNLCPSASQIHLFKNKWWFSILHMISFPVITTFSTSRLNFKPL